MKQFFSKVKIFHCEKKFITILKVWLQLIFLIEIRYFSLNNIETKLTPYKKYSHLISTTVETRTVRHCCTIRMPAVNSDLHQALQRPLIVTKLTFCFTACFTAPSASVTPSLCVLLCAWKPVPTYLNCVCICECMCVCERESTHGGQYGWAAEFRPKATRTFGQKLWHHMPHMHMTCKWEAQHFHIECSVFKQDDSDFAAYASI